MADNHWTIIEGSQDTKSFHQALLTSKIYTNDEIHDILHQCRTDKIDPLPTKTSIFDFNTLRYIAYKKIDTSFIK